MLIRILIPTLAILVSMQGQVLAAGNVSRGAVLAQRNCGSCHATGLKGVSPNPKSPTFRTLASRYPLKDLEESLAEGIMVGHEGLEMPVFEMRTSQIADLMAYLTSIQRKK